MSKKIKTFLYWVSILPPVLKAVKGVIRYCYESYMNTLMEIEQRKMEEDFDNSWKENRNDN